VWIVGTLIFFANFARFSLRTLRFKLLFLTYCGIQ
jgi:hypothetical protein